MEPRRRGGTERDRKFEPRDTEKMRRKEEENWNHGDTEARRGIGNLGTETQRR